MIIESNPLYQLKWYLKSNLLKQKELCKLCERYFYKIKYHSHIEICQKKEQQKAIIVNNARKINANVHEVIRYSQKLHSTIFENFKKQSN